MDGDHEKKEFSYPKREDVIEQIKALDDDIQHVSLNLIKCNFDATESDVKKTFPEYTFIKVKNYNPGSFELVFEMKIDAINFIRNCFDRKILGRRFFIKLGRQHKEVVEDWACVGYVPKKFNQPKHKGPHQKREDGEKQEGGEKTQEGEKKPEHKKHEGERPERPERPERQVRQYPRKEGQEANKQEVKKVDVNSDMKKEQKKEVVVQKIEPVAPKQVKKVEEKKQQKPEPKKTETKKPQAKQVETKKQKEVTKPVETVEQKKEEDDGWITVTTKGKKR